MDRGRRAEPYSNATIWTREIARNLAGHLSRVSKAHSCVDTRSPKSTRLPQFHHSYVQKRCPTSPIKTRQSLVTIARNPNPSDEQELDFRRLGGGSAREETDGDAKQGLVQSSIGDVPLQLKSCISNAEFEVNQEISDRPVRIPAVKPPAKQPLGNANGSATDMITYESPAILPHHRHRLAHDYYKRQEQKKIWQENQALIRRLQNTKATLNAKKWEKDGKWTQEFLKNQEKRRSALQQELRRAQVSPQAVLRSKPLKSLHPHHLQSVHHQVDLSCSPTKEDVSGALSARTSARRGSKECLVLGRRGSSDATVQQASAANHRRIMELRKQKTPTSHSSEAVEACSMVNNQAGPLSGEQAAYIPDNEIVNVRFTFSRGRSRGTDTKANEMEQLGQLAPLELDRRDRDIMSLSGAFSPGVELESALNEASEKDTVAADQPGRGQTPEVIVDPDNGLPTEANNCQQSYFEAPPDNSSIVALSGEVGVENGNKNELPATEAKHSHDGKEQCNRTTIELTEDTAIANGSPELSLASEQMDNAVHGADVETSDVDQADVAESPVETEGQSSPPPPEPEQSQSGDEEEEAYDGDNFDDDPLLSGRAQGEANDKHEGSGYASEFEEEPGTEIHDVVHDTTATDNQDGGDDAEEDGSYSHDDFE